MDEHLSFSQYANRVGQPPDIAQIVAGKQHCRFALADRPQHAVQKILVNDGVQARRRLVEDQYLRPMADGQQQSQLDHVALGKVFDFFAPVEFELILKLAGTDRHPMFRKMARVKLMTSSHGHPGIDIMSFGHVANAPSDLRRIARPRRSPERGPMPAVGASMPIRILMVSALAGAVGTDQAQRRAARDRERNVVDGGRGAITLRNTDQFDGRRCHIRFASCGALRRFWNVPGRNLKQLANSFEAQTGGRRGCGGQLEGLAGRRFGASQVPSALRARLRTCRRPVAT